MRDAVRAKATYNASKHIENAPIQESPEPVSPKEPLSPITISPMLVSPGPNETTPNGSASKSDKGSEVIANESGSVKGSDVITNGSTEESVEGSEVVANGSTNESVKESEGFANGDGGCEQGKEVANSYGKATNGIPATVWILINVYSELRHSLEFIVYTHYEPCIAK